MDSRFATLRQRDTSVSMLRVKMSRRRSQSQKENRDQMVNTRRNLGKLQEMEVSCLDATTTNMSVIQEKPAKSKAVERLKQLERWKERKALEKEKEKRLKERKGVFKTGIYHHNDAAFQVLPAVSTKAKEKKVDMCHSSRVTRSMKQQQQHVRVQEPVVAKNAQPIVEKPSRTRAASVKSAPTTAKAKSAAVVVRAVSTRSANRRPVTAAPPMKGKSEDARITRSTAVVKPLPSSTEAVNSAILPAVQDPEVTVPQVQTTEYKMCPSIPSERSEEKDVLAKELSESEPSSTSPSFAPEGFVFQAPVGLSSFKFDPLTPRSADAFLTPSPSFNLPPCPVFTDPSTESNESTHTLPLRDPPTADPAVSGSSLESKHDVPYFRSEIINETAKLTNQSLDWESKVEEESIPEEMRDRMRTAVGQARLLMKERFTQFSGLVDDCELGRGEKITTCTDLQGFWDMVYFQVEDVHRKFDALKAAEGRGWVEEHQPPPRQRKIVKRAATASSKPVGAKAAAAAKSRLAAIKAAMKAKKQETEDVITGSVRRSSRLSAAILPPSSPCSTYRSPRRSTRCSNAGAQTPTCVIASPAQIIRTPAHFHLVLQQTPASKSTCETPESKEDAGDVDLSFSSVEKELSGDSLSERSPSDHSHSAATEESAASPPEMNSPMELPPTISVVVEKDEPAELVDSPTCSLRNSLSPYKTLPYVSNPTPELSFTLSPGERSPIKTQPSVCDTPDSPNPHDVRGLDNRYFQPQRCSLSPLQAVDTQTLSPTVLEVEMKSPGSPSDDLIEQQEQALPVVSSLLTSQSTQMQTAESALLLFTPNVNDRIRQSVCPSDLMVFTPPNM